MIKEKIQQFYSAKFQFEGKIYEVKNCDVKGDKAYLYTDKRTFAFYEMELDEFIEKIKFVDLANSSPVPVTAISDDSKQKNNDKLEVTVENVNLAIKSEIITSNQRANRMADKMEEMFNRLSESPTDEVIKQAQAMRDMSNSIVNVEMMKFKLLTGL